MSNSSLNLRSISKKLQGLWYLKVYASRWAEMFLTFQQTNQCGILPQYQTIYICKILKWVLPSLTGFVLRVQYFNLFWFIRNYYWVSCSVFINIFFVFVFLNKVLQHLENTVKRSRWVAVFFWGLLIFPGFGFAWYNKASWLLYSLCASS
jgi:hypothetical protein